MGMQGVVAWQLLANKIVVIFYFILYSVIIMTTSKIVHGILLISQCKMATKNQCLFLPQIWGIFRQFLIKTLQNNILSINILWYCVHSLA